MLLFSFMILNQGAFAELTDLRLDYDRHSVVAIPYARLGLSHSVFTYELTPLRMRYLVGDDGSVLYPDAKSGTSRVLFEVDSYSYLDFREPRYLFEEEKGERPPVYLLSQLKLMIAKEAPPREPFIGGRAQVIAPLFSKGPTHLVVAHKTDWISSSLSYGVSMEKKDVRSGISIVSLISDEHDKNRLIASFDWPRIIATASKDLHSDRYMAVVRSQVEVVVGDAGRTCSEIVLIDGDRVEVVVSLLETPSNFWAASLYNSKTGLAVVNGFDETLHVIDTRKKTKRRVKYDGSDRAELFVRNLAWDSDYSILVGVLKKYPRKGARPLELPKLYRFDLRTEQWEYLGPYALIGSSADGKWLVLTKLGPEKQVWLLYRE